MESENKQNIDKLVMELKYLMSSVKDDQNDNDISKVLDSLVDLSKNSINEISEIAIDDLFIKLLRQQSKAVVAKTAKAIAEIAKTENGREKCTEERLIKQLLVLLKSKDVETLTQVSRALGNICFDNGKGKKLVRDVHGQKEIMSVLKTAIDLKDTEGSVFLRNVAAGLLLNFLVEQENLREMVGIDSALEEDNIVTIISDILEIDGTNDRESATYALLTLGILNDDNIEFLDERLTRILVTILASDASSEILEMCLESLHGQAENEGAKLLLAKNGVCELLLKLLEKHGPKCTDEETRSVLKVACNLIVLILTGDESMNLLYDGSNGITYKKLVDWLNSSDEDLRVTAVLAMGNFARTDTHCELMVSQKVHCKLLKLIQENNDSSGDIRFQHALLSAIRNLVIPMSNKSIILSDGLIESIYPMLDIPTFPVVFKLLGTLRIVIDKQQETATDLGKKEDLIRRTVDWCKIEDHPGVQGEANRLIAWLIKNSRDKEVTNQIIKHDGVKHLVKMLTAQHILMQNEALTSLVVLTTISLPEAEKVLLEANIGAVIIKFINDSEKLEDKMLLNAITLCNSLIKSDVLKLHLQEVNVEEAWRKVVLDQKGKFAKDLKDKVKKLCISLDCTLSTN